MKRAECAELLEFLKIRLPEVDAWLAKMEPESRRDQTLDAWSEVFCRADLEHAKEAVRLIHAGEEAEPRAWSRLPAAIVAIARKLGAAEKEEENKRHHGPKLVEGEWVYECLQCRDEGVVSCWHPVSLRELAAQIRDPNRPQLGQFLERGRGIFGEVQTYRFTPSCCAVACTCRAGQRYRGSGMRTLDRERDLPLYREDPDGEWRLHFATDPDEIEAARAFVAGLMERAQAGSAEVPAGPQQQEIPF